jgi:hypothetical protein
VFDEVITAGDEDWIQEEEKNFYKKSFTLPI